MALLGMSFAHLLCGIVCGGEAKNPNAICPMAFAINSINGTNGGGRPDWRRRWRGKKARVPRLPPRLPHVHPQPIRIREMPSPIGVPIKNVIKNNVHTPHELYRRSETSLVEKKRATTKTLPRHPKTLLYRLNSGKCQPQ